MWIVMFYIGFSPIRLCIYIPFFSLALPFYLNKYITHVRTCILAYVCKYVSVLICIHKCM